MTDFNKLFRDIETRQKAEIQKGIEENGMHIAFSMSDEPDMVNITIYQPLPNDRQALPPAAIQD